MAYQNKPISLGLNTPNYENDLERIAAERMLADGFMGQNMPYGSAPVEVPQQSAVPAMTPYTIPNINLPQFNAPEAPVYTPYSDTEQGRQLIDELSKKRMEAEERQREQMNQAQVQLQDYLSKQQSVDLLPMAALVDTWTGSNMARYFKDEKDVNRELALELQKELLKYGNLGIASEAEYLKDRLGAGTYESKIGAQLSQEKYEADLRARQSLYDTNLDTAAKLKIADDARKAGEALERFKQSEAYKRAQLRTGRQRAGEARQERSEDRQVAFKLTDNENYKSENTRLKLLGLLDEYEKEVQANGITVKPGEAKTKLNSIYQRFVSAQKEADNLGALTGSDLKIVWGQMPDATSLLYAGESYLGGAGTQGIFNAIQRARNEIERDHNISLEKLRTSFGGLSSDVDQRIDRFDKNFKSTYSKLQKPEDLPKVGTQAPEVKPLTREQKIEAVKRKMEGK
jgi:hypothetical protein